MKTVRWRHSHGCSKDHWSGDDRRFVCPKQDVLVNAEIQTLMRQQESIHEKEERSSHTTKILPDEENPHAEAAFWISE